MRVLDLFCGAGGAAMGLHHAWPQAEIVGVDIKPQPRYPFTFIQADALGFGYTGFDFIWASPPCQRYSEVTPKKNRDDHPDLIEEVQVKIAQTTAHYCIENVAGARHLLKKPTMLCGSMFGLHTRRHRWFETSFTFKAPSGCDHSNPVLLVTTAGANSRAIGNFKSVKNAPMAYGIDWMKGDELKEAIPPAYSEFIARQCWPLSGDEENRGAWEELRTGVYAPIDLTLDRQPPPRNPDDLPGPPEPPRPPRDRYVRSEGL